MKRRKPQPTTVYSKLDELLASDTQPMPERNRTYQLRRMSDALHELMHVPQPSNNAWRVVSDAVNLLETLVQALSAARAEADSVLEDAALSFTIAHIDYVARYGGRCRGCADESGVCPGSGLPCANPRKAIKHVFDALEYGVKNGFIELPNASRAKPAAALLTETCPGAPNFDGGAAYELAMNIDAARKQAAPKAAPQQEAQEPCPTCAALARTVMLDQVSFDRKPDCYGIRQVTDDEGVEEWEDIRTSPDVAREEANDMMATGRGEIYEVVPLWTTPQPAPAPLSEMPYEKRKAIQEGEQISASDAWFHARLNMLDTLDRRNVFRAGFDRGWNAALAAQGGK